MIGNVCPFDPILNVRHASDAEAVAWGASMSLAIVFAGLSIWFRSGNGRARVWRIVLRTGAILLFIVACGISARDQAKQMDEDNEAARRDLKKMIDRKAQ
jgi:hypothetical protein